MEITSSSGVHGGVFNTPSINPGGFININGGYHTFAVGSVWNGNGILYSGSAYLLVYSTITGTILPVIHLCTTYVLQFGGMAYIYSPYTTNADFTVFGGYIYFNSFSCNGSFILKGSGSQVTFGGVAVIDSLYVSSPGGWVDVYHTGNLTVSKKFVWDGDNSYFHTTSGMFHLKLKSNCKRYRWIASHPCFWM